MRPPVRFDNDDFVSLFTYQEKAKNERNSYDDAIKGTNFVKWFSAIEEDIYSLLKKIKLGNWLKDLRIINR